MRSHWLIYSTILPFIYWSDKIDFTTMPLAEKIKVKRNDTTTDKSVSVQCGCASFASDKWTDAPLGTWAGATMSALKITNSSFTAAIRRFDGATLQGVYYFNWIAIGQA